MLATIFTIIYGNNESGPSQETSTGEGGIVVLGFRCSIVCIYHHHHKSSSVSILVAPSNLVEANTELWMPIWQLRCWIGKDGQLGSGSSN